MSNSALLPIDGGSAFRYGATTLIASDRHLEPEPERPIRLQVVAGPRFEPATRLKALTLRVLVTSPFRESPCQNRTRCRYRLVFACSAGCPYAPLAELPASRAVQVSVDLLPTYSRSAADKGLDPAELGAGRSGDKGGPGVIGNSGWQFGADLSLPTLPIPDLSHTYPLPMFLPIPPTYAQTRIVRHRFGMC